jgi:peptidoglycan/LPS O-acetylase OafA/YrhL
MAKNLSTSPLRPTIASIELLRGLATVAVCLYHFTNGHHHFISEQNWIKAIAGKGWLGVEVFFVISGFVIPFAMARSQYQWRHLPVFLLKRWLRIDPPYWLSILFALGLNGLAQCWLGDSQPVSLQQVLLHFAYLLVFFAHFEWLNGVYWTLAIEFQYYLLIGLLFPLLYHAQKVYFWLSVLMLLGLAVFSSFPAFFFDYAMFFVLGFLLFQRYEKRLGEALFLLASALVFGLIFYKFSLQYCLAGFLPWVLIAYWPNLRLPALRWLGMISYSLYLIHMPLAKKLIPLAARHLEGDGPRLVFVLLLFVFTASLAYGFYHLIEKPAIRWSSAFQYKKSSSDG